MSRKTTPRPRGGSARKTAARKATVKPARAERPPLRRRLRRYGLRGVLGLVALVFVVVFLFSFIRPPTTFYIASEKRRLGEVDYQWVPMESIAPVMARSVVAAEDANFCEHWGFDMSAIRRALEDGGARGASTISQQTVKNLFLWQGRSWPRKALEALLTPVMETLWSKRRILEMYLNIIEFDEGVFGIEAAAQRYFKVAPADLTATQAARLAAILPDPKDRNAARPTAFLRKRSADIADGAATLRADGRSACFES
ncbi:monofunctional biosynthetic peptidoglycan transglycosylase [Brevirhabdus sp.]|uniref:monofunctional biosynthetic peptidoglycan transglycosylase n=1 Tax=Brevirhabdus sp. TaxID=2004514 RepID=UPI004058DF01